MDALDCHDSRCPQKSGAHMAAFRSSIEDCMLMLHGKGMSSYRAQVRRRINTKRSYVVLARHEHKGVWDLHVDLGDGGRTGRMVMGTYHLGSMR